MAQAKTLSTKDLNQRKKKVTFILDSPRAKSSVQFRGVDNSNIETAKAFSIPVSSQIPNPVAGGYIQTMFIPGAPHHYVDDYYDKDGNLQKGLKSLGWDDKKLKEGYNKALSFVRVRKVHFQFGRLTLDRTGENAKLVDYLLESEFCMDSPHYEAMSQYNKSSLIRFHVEHKEADAEKRIRRDKVFIRVTELLGKLSKETENGFEYEELEIDALMSVLGLANTAEHYEYGQKVVAISEAAQSNPEAFLKFYESQTATYKVQLAHAIELGVVSIEGKSAVFARDKKEITPFKSTSKDGKFTELVLHFMGKGSEDYKLMNILAESAQKQNALNK